MRLILCFGLIAGVAIATMPREVYAQTDNTVAVPPAPSIVASPPSSLPPPPPPVTAAPPSLVQTPAPAPSPASGGAATSPDLTALPQPPNNWSPGVTARLGVLDKVDGSTSEVAIQVGGQTAIGDLSVSVLACVTRPAGQIPDAAIFIAVQGSGASPDTAVYRGWMVRSAPGAAVVGDASETLRVVSCS